MSNLLLNKLPLEVNLRRFGFQGPSVCICCHEKEEETCDHLFSFGDIPNSIWQYFENPLGIRGLGFHLRRRCLSFWMYHSHGDIMTKCLKILPSLICWYIWKWRNNIIFEGSNWSFQFIISEIWKYLLIILKSSFKHFDLRAHSWIELIDLLDNRPSISRTIQVIWKFPSRALKLNTNGSSRGNPGPSSGGGVLRNESGLVLFAFSEFFGLKTNLQAEAQALLLGLCICHQLDISNVIVECDSASLINMVCGKASIPWKLKVVLKKIERYKFRIKDYSHCYRQANCVADALANFAHSSQKFQMFSSAADLPSFIKTLVFQDLIGLCNLRTV